MFIYHENTSYMCFQLMWNKRWICHSLAFWCHSVGTYCYLCSPTPFGNFKTVVPQILSNPVPSSYLFHLTGPYPAPTLIFIDHFPSLPSSYLSLPGGWIAPLPVVSAGVPCSRPNTCHWSGDYHRNHIPWCKALAPVSDWSLEPCSDRGGTGNGRGYSWK